LERRATERHWAVLLAEAPPGHVGCGNVREFNATLNPLNALEWTDVVKQYYFLWNAIPFINDLASTTFHKAFSTSPAPLVRLNAFEAFKGQVQAHPASTGLQKMPGGAKDCLHYCDKGPMHVYPEMIHNALLSLGPIGTRFNRTARR
jgi:hypothetical protein